MSELSAPDTGVFPEPAARAASVEERTSGPELSHIVQPSAVDLAPAAPRPGTASRWRKWSRYATSRLHMSRVARLLLALYFINLTAEQVEVWYRLAGVPQKRRWADDPVSDVTFPYLWVALVLPAALLVAGGVQVLASGSVLLAVCFLQDAYFLWRQVVNVLWYGARPNELIVKRVAVTGAALLVLTDAVRGNPQLRRSYAGLLFTGDSEDEGEEEGHPPGHTTPATGRQRRVGGWRSALLLVGRLAICALMLYSGVMQCLRIRARGSLWVEPGVTHHYGVQDSHDNTWVLIQMAITIPLALGFKTRPLCWALAAVLCCEAVTCWPFWSRAWPSWWYSAHVRLHFFSNLALVGALMQLQSSGPGMFAVDELLKKQE